MTRSFDGTFFDGRTATGTPVRALFAPDGLEITPTSGEVFFWPYRKIKRLSRSAKDLRLGLSHKDFKDAVLVLPAAAHDVLIDVGSRHHSPAANMRKQGFRIGGLITITAAIAAFMFFGVPAMSGPLAQATPKSVETRIGGNLAAQINLFYRKCGADEPTLKDIRLYLNEMATAGDVGFDIEFNLVRTSMPNAFALPGGQTMATSGLLHALGDDQEAFLAVMAHELGHVRARDSMQAVYRNAGLSILLEVITGGSGIAQQMVLLAGQLNELSHTRQQEDRADDAAIDIMIANGLDPSALARAFDAIVAAHGDHDHSHDNEEEGAGDSERDVEESGTSLPDWLGTHPSTDKRIEKARKAQVDRSRALPLSAEDWQSFTEACN